MCPFTVIARNRIDASIRFNMRIRFRYKNKIRIVFEDTVAVLITRLCKIIFYKVRGRIT